jgi:FkbM family methyltransferase
MAAVARPLHTWSIYALGHGTAELPVTESGERYPIELVEGDSPVVFDIGAFHGDYALMVRRILGAAAIIYCFEPNPERFASLQHLDGFSVHQLAMAADSGERTLYEDPDAPDRASLHYETVLTAGLTPSVENVVQTATLDEFCDEQGVERIDLLKIDVEGAEAEVLGGAADLLTRRAIGILQFEFGYGSLANRSYMHDFYDLLGGTHDLYRITPRGLVSLGSYRLELEVFTSATNYVAVPR